MKQDQDFEELYEVFEKFISKRKNIEERNYILELGFDNITENTELTTIDLFQVFLSVLLMIHKIALDQQEFKLCGLIKSSFEKETKFMEKHIKLIDDEILKENLELELFFTIQYFDETINLLNEQYES